MKSLLSIVPDNVIHALGWTIFHSLWQGLIIGLILLMIFKFRSNISSQARYVLGVFALAAIFFSSLFTFLVAYEPISSYADLITTSPEHISGAAGNSKIAGVLLPGQPELSGWQQRLTGIFDFVSIIWFVGVLLLTARLAGGMMVVRGMRRQSVSPMPAGWEQRLQVIAAKTGLRRSITYLQSQKVMVPTVIGILRPVVLIPSMIISGLPADQLETIIVHELAHIRRHDFLVNIMQSIMEALFFYHPVVWIISENIRQDREKCCDDYTVKICGQVSLYARALACLSELQITAAVPSVAITGNKKNILHRVERLINNKKMKTNLTERLMAGLVLLTSVLVITLSTGATFKPSGFAQVESQIALPFWDKEPAVPVTDPEPVTKPVPVTAPTAVAEPAAVTTPTAVTEPVPVTAPTAISEPATVTAPTIAVPSIPALPADTSHRHHREKMEIENNTVTRDFHNKEGEDHEIKFVIKQGKVEELYVDGQRIPDNEFSRYQKEIDVTLDDLHDMEKNLKHARMELDNVDFDKIREDMRIEMEHFKQHEMKDLHEDMMKLHEEQVKVHIDQYEMQADIEQAMKDIQIDQEKMQEEMFKAQEEIKNAMEEFKDGNQELSEEEFEQAMKEMELGMAETKKAMAMLETAEMQEMMEEALKSVQEIEEAMKHIEEIDLSEIEKDIQSAMSDMEKTKIDLEKEKKNIDEMIEELEKLELDDK